MRDISSFNKIYLARDPADFRKHAHGLTLIVEHSLGKMVNHEKTLFMFTNKRRNAVKLIYWDQTGIAMWWKALEKDRFRWPKNDDEVFILKPRELRWLLDGIDLNKVKTHQKIDLD